MFSPDTMPNRTKQGEAQPYSGIFQKTEIAICTLFKINEVGLF